MSEGALSTRGDDERALKTGTLSIEISFGVTFVQLPGTAKSDVGAGKMWNGVSWMKITSGCMNERREQWWSNYVEDGSAGWDEVPSYTTVPFSLSRLCRRFQDNASVVLRVCLR